MLKHQRSIAVIASNCIAFWSLSHHALLPCKLFDLILAIVYVDIGRLKDDGLDVLVVEPIEDGDESLYFEGY